MDHTLAAVVNIPDRIYLLFFHSPQMSNFPESGQFRGHPSGETEAVVVYVDPCWPRGYFGFGWGGGDQNEVLDVLAKVVGDLDLPLNQPFSCVKGQHDCHVLADDCDGIRFLVQRKSRLHAKELLKRQRRLCLAVLVTVLGIPVELQVETICKE